MRWGLSKTGMWAALLLNPLRSSGMTGVKMKLSANSTVVKGKRLILLDDSIVRGNHIPPHHSPPAGRSRSKRSPSPHRLPRIPVSVPSIGVDMSTRQELISSSMDTEALCSFLGADSLRFLEVDDLKKAYGGHGFCFACFDGNYVTQIYSYLEKLK